MDACLPVLFYRMTLDAPGGAGRLESSGARSAGSFQRFVALLDILVAANALVVKCIFIVSDLQKWISRRPAFFIQGCFRQIVATRCTAASDRFHKIPRVMALLAADPEVDGVLKGDAGAFGFLGEFLKNHFAHGYAHLIVLGGRHRSPDHTQYDQHRYRNCPQTLSHFDPLLRSPKISRTL
jgi:hypothetical protein